MKDYLIVGQGVAGSFLAWELIQRQQDVIVVDDSHQSSSSIISAGIINPITGKRFVVTPHFDQFFSFAQSAYAQLDQVFNDSFFETKPVLRLIQDDFEQELWREKQSSDDIKKYYSNIYPPHKYSSNLDDSLGSFEISQAGFCRSEALLKAFENYFQEKNILRPQHFSYDAIEIDKNSVIFNNERFKKIIFCEGYKAQDNPWFKSLPFACAKGEILRLSMNSSALPDAILNKTKWCVPVKANEWMAGSNYNWDQCDCLPTDCGAQEILEGLAFIKKGRPHITDHKAGVRPVIRDRKAVLGLLPSTPEVGIFNGLGSKGFLLAPYYAHQLAESLIKKTQIKISVNIERFF